MGWGIFNVLEGVVDHHILGVHHVNELVAAAHRGAYDFAFLAWGAAMIVGGWAMWRSGRRRHSAEAEALRLAARHGG